MQEKISKIITEAVLVLIGVYGIAIFISINISPIYFELLILLYIFPSYIVLLFLTIIKIIDLKNLKHEEDEQKLHPNRISIYKPIFDKYISFHVAIIASLIPIFNNILCIYILFQLLKEFVLFIKTQITNKIGRRLL